MEQSVATSVSELVNDAIERSYSARQAEARHQCDAQIEAMEEMRQWVFGLLQNNNLKQVFIARKAGLSTTAVSQWLNRRYPGSDAEVLSKLRRWRESLERVEQAPPAPTQEQWVETPTSKRIEQALAFAQIEPTIVVIYGNPGVGKTTSIAKYQREQRNVWVAACEPASCGFQATIAKVADAVGLRSLPMTPHQQSREIVKQIRGSNGLLIIDEAQHLNREAIDQLRTFHDSASIGLCLSGNMEVYSQVYGRENSQYLAQFSSRVGNRIVLREPMPGDVDAVLELWNIHGAAEVEYARLIASQPGALRSLRQCLTQARNTALGRGCPIDVELMRGARQWLGFGEGQ